MQRLSANVSVYSSYYHIQYVWWRLNTYVCMYKATVNNVNLPLLLKICEDRDNLSSHTYMHEDTTTSSIIDFLDLFTL